MRTSNLAEALIEYPLPRDRTYETKVQEERSPERIDFGTAAESFSTATIATNTTFTFRLSTSAPLAPQQGNLEALPAAINGAVLGLDDETVVAELHPVDAKSVRVRMPRALFPNDIGLGTPITLKLDDSTGVRIPVITLRELPRREQDGEIAALRALVDSL